MRAFAAIAAVAALVGFTNADLTHSEMANDTSVSTLAAGGFSCAKLKPHLNKADCEYMSKIGIRGQGENALSPNGKAWIGTQGPYTFKFTNNAIHPAARPVTLILWTWQNAQDYQAMCVNVRAPKISVSLPRPGDSITISLAAGVTGAFASLDGHETRLNNVGQVDNTWGEFNTGSYATFDVSREVNSKGHAMDIRGSNGCVSNLVTCVFKCKDANARTCGAAGSYHLVNCGGKNPGAHTDNGGADGGCGGWGSGRKHLDVLLRWAK
ncbi:hypothetical protein LMH87_012313 [Akanthomyces muscarius]|uniref:Uncharacterized protein n=1 Tax=Akanthomyces muscarius TaxID=2231603 RepID=A0A9W8UJB8_AKAMU|nr:hypothetical protein LMH87_012313 [Akanthomyces muscarius]KAJ4151623.1 hypothetical protein LMH87_012313 [Akanthomyces muscarius]